MFWVLAAAVLSSLPAIQAVPATSCSLFPNRMVGHGYIDGERKTDTAGECCATCGSVYECSAWTWHSDKKNCILKNNAAQSDPSTHNSTTSGLKPGATCNPKQQPSMCPLGTTCYDCGGPLCPCSWKPGPSPPSPPKPPVPLVPACTAPHNHYPFCNTSLAIEDRITNLMTYIDDAVKPNLLTARGGPDGLQNLSHVGVPSYYWGTNCLHSVGAPCTFDGHCPTNFPSGPSMAASFDRKMIADVATTVGRELRALYNVGTAQGLDCWGPVINLNRDPRWGRNGEGGAEDPYLMGELAASWTDGFQTGRPEESKGYLQGVITLKHYVANTLDNTKVVANVTVDGQHYTAGDIVNRHTIDVTVSNYMLQDYLAAFRSAVKVGARGLMCSYNSVDGIPTCLSPMLKKAREVWTGKTPWGGYITSDTDSVDDAVHLHHYVKDAANASCMAVRDGGDDVDSGNTYYDNLARGVASGMCAQADVDAAVRNTMRVRFEMGLFDPTDEQPLTKLNASDVGAPEAAQLSLRGVAESLVLLKNDNNFLPLSTGQKIAVVGPHANASRFLIQVDTGQICGGDGTFDCVESPFRAIQAMNVGGTTTMAVGADLINPSISTQALHDDAVAKAKAADIVVLAIGIAQCGCMGIADTYMGGKATNPEGCATSVVPPYTPWGNCWGHQEVTAGAYVGAEAHDRISIDLPPSQRKLADAILAVGKPTILLLINGGSVDYGKELSASTAAIEAFYPGLEGAAVIANTLFGKGPNANRFGRMPYTTYPASFALDAPMLEQDMTVAPGRTHKYYTGSPVVEFGAGLSYTTFELSVDVPASITIRTDGSLMRNMTITAKNTGHLTGDVVLLAYIIPKALPTQPGSKLLQKLWQFERLSDVASGKSASVTFAITPEAVSLTDLTTGDLVSAPGQFGLVIKDGTTQLEVQLTVEGKQQILEAFPKV